MSPDGIWHSGLQDNMVSDVPLAVQIQYKFRCQYSHMHNSFAVMPGFTAEFLYSF